MFKGFVYGSRLHNESLLFIIRVSGINKALKSVMRVAVDTTCTESRLIILCV